MSFLDRVVEETKEKYWHRDKNLTIPSVNQKKNSEKIYKKLTKKFLVITECKKASPSRGIIAKRYSIPPLVKAYEEGGARAISILTEEKYFLGSFKDITKAKQNTSLPILCKDFVLTKHQVVEAWQTGASLVLLIVKILPPALYLELANLICQLGMVPLVEIFDYEEFQVASTFKGSFFLGINNRNLNTLTTNVDHAITIKKKIQKSFPQFSAPIISESGLTSFQEVALLKENGFSGILVGEHLLLQQDKKKALKKLLNG